MLATLGSASSRPQNPEDPACMQQPQVWLKGIYTRLLSGQTGNLSISVGLNCLQVKTRDQRSPVVVSSSSIVKSVQSSPEGQIIQRSFRISIQLLSSFNEVRFFGRHWSKTQLKLWKWKLSWNKAHLYGLINQTYKSVEDRITHDKMIIFLKTFW